MTSDRTWHPREGDKRRVVVVGAGIAGLTAAHELAERGFEVEVVEAAADAPENGPAIGGMARTSWAAVQAPRDQFPLAESATTRSLPITQLRQDTDPATALFSIGDFFQGNDVVISSSVQHFLDSLHEAKEIAVFVSGAFDVPHRSAFESALAQAAKRRCHVTYVGSESGKADSPRTKKATRVLLGAASARLPGEHGFRFFPSFYRNMFDTMKRIPLPEAAIEPVPDVPVSTSDSARTAFDALESADAIGLELERERGRTRSYEISRRPFRSLQQLRELMQNVLERAGYRGQDIHRLALRYYEYLTSSLERRRDQYEKVSWGDFLGLDEGYSAYFASHVNGGAQALAAMSSDSNDARTIGSIAVQLTLDEIRTNESGYSDATLRGPTSLALFEPWRAYLEALGVVFTHAKLVGFEGTDMVTRPVFVMEKKGRIAPADYYVIAIPIQALQALFDEHGTPTTSLPDGPDLLDRAKLYAANDLCLELDKLEHADPPRVRELPLRERDDLRRHFDYPMNDYTRHPDQGPLRWMCGIQFYFDADVRLFRGHALCLDSPWGVSYISQERYWQDRTRGQSGARGVLSAIFTRFEVAAPGKYDRTSKAAFDCDADGIADRVWRQIEETWDVDENGPLPQPRYYYLDANLEPGESWTNASPYLVNAVGDWERRGGARCADGDYVYPVQLGHTVFAGIFMRTATRLNSMEAANESGRRAVNSLLDRARVRGERVPVYHMEDFEVPELRPLRELDAKVFRRGGRHVLRSTLAEASLRAIPWDLMRFGLPTRGEER